MVARSISGELVNLRRIDIDLVNGIVEVTRTLTERDDGTLDVGHTKSDAGRRTVPVHALVLPDLSAHIGEHVGDADAGATTRELIRRMKHSTVRAAMRYQHSTDHCDREIAAELSQRAALQKGE